MGALLGIPVQLANQPPDELRYPNSSHVGGSNGGALFDPLKPISHPQGGHSSRRQREASSTDLDKASRRSDRLSATRRHQTRVNSATSCRSLAERICCWNNTTTTATLHSLQLDFTWKSCYHANILACFTRTFDSSTICSDCWV